MPFLSLFHRLGTILVSNLHPGPTTMPGKGDWGDLSDTNCNQSLPICDALGRRETSQTHLGREAVTHRWAEPEMHYVHSMASWGLCKQEAGIHDRWRFSQKQRPPQHQKLGDAAVQEEDLFTEYLYVVWKLGQNLRAVTSIMIHKLWTCVAGSNTVGKGNAVPAHVAPQLVRGGTLDESLSHSSTYFACVCNGDDGGLPRGGAQGGTHMGSWHRVWAQLLCWGFKVHLGAWRGWLSFLPNIKELGNQQAPQPSRVSDGTCMLMFGWEACDFPEGSLESHS